MNEQMRESRLHVSFCVYDSDSMAGGGRGFGRGSRIGLEEMGLLLRRLNKSSEGYKWPYLFSIIFSMFVHIWDRE